MHDWHDFFYHVPSSPEKGIYRIFEPQWKAEILHWFSREDIPKEQKEAFIKSLIDFNDGCGNFYRYRAYFFASEAIVRFNDCNLGDEIVGQLLKWGYDYFRQDRQDWKIFPDKLVEVAREAIETTDRERVIAAFVDIVHTTESRTVLQLAATRLGQLDPGNQIAITALILLMQVTENRSKLSKIVISLGETGAGNEAAISALVQLLQISTEADVEEAHISNTLYFLKKIGYGNQTAIALLVSLMETTLNEYFCQEIIKTLAIIAKDDRTATDALVRFLQKNQSDNLCCEAAQALLQIEPENSLAIDTLSYILETDKAKYVNFDIAQYVAQINKSNKDAIATLANFIKSSNFYISYEDFDALEKAAKNNETILAALLQFLENNQDKWTRLSVLRIIPRVEPSNKTAFAAFYEILNATQDEWQCYNIAKNLLEIDPENEIAFSALSQILKTAKHKWTRLEIAQKLLHRDGDRQQAVDALSELVFIDDFGNSMSDANPALTILESIDPSHQLAIQALVQLTNSTWEQDALIYAAKHLKRLEPGNRIAQEKLNTLISTVLRSIQTLEEDNDTFLFNSALYWRGMMQSDLLSKVVTAFKPYLSEWYYKQAFISYGIAYSIIWDCAQKMSYPDFHKAWHEKLEVAPEQ